MKQLSSARCLALHVMSWMVVALVAVLLYWLHWPPKSLGLALLYGFGMFGLFVITMQTLAWSLCMKSVILDGDLLIVRGIFRSDVVPLSTVRNVFQNFWFPLKKVHPIVIQFGSPCRFGTHILFIPKGDGVRLRKKWGDLGWIEHPVVQEIRDEMARVNGTTPKGGDFGAS